jgi:hypothetical protein
MKVVRVTKDEFELEDGSVHPIIPSLEKETTPYEFQKHYDRACTFVEGGKDSGIIKSGATQLGQHGKD